MKIIQKILFIAVVGLFVGNAEGHPWNNNTREHLFGYIDQGNQANVTIEDEGFRWRNSFNFTINGQVIPPQNWWFNKTIDTAFIDGTEENIDSSNIDNFIFEKTNSYNNNYSSNFIHSHLAKIADKIKQINNCASVTTAAITIIIEDNGNYYAFSKMLCNDSNQIIVARTLTNNRNANALISYPDIRASSIKNILQDRQPNIACNVSNQYSCSEGQLITQIKNNNFELIKRIISELLAKAKQQCENVINYTNVKLVILHVGTTMDPCAICTRCSVGVSKCINENIDNFLRSTDQGAPAGNMHNAKFFVEVSTNGHYATGAQYDRRRAYILSNDKQDNFAAFGCGNCSHTECAGHDGGEAIPINISLNFPSVGELAIPYGRIPQNNWALNRTFPPYVVFGRVDNNYNIIASPMACNIDNHGHTMGVNLSPIQ